MYAAWQGHVRERGVVCAETDVEIVFRQLYVELPCRWCIWRVLAHDVGAVFSVDVVCLREHTFAWSDGVLERSALFSWSWGKWVNMNSCRSPEYCFLCIYWCCFLLPV